MHAGRSTLALTVGLALGLSARDLGAQMGGVAVEGDVPSPWVVTAETFRTLDPVLVAAESEGTVHVYRAVPLHCFLEQAGIPFGEALRGPAFTATVLVEGRDGSRVVFALAALDEAFGGEVYLADQMDGALLSPADGPYRIIVPGDARPARWVRQASRIVLRSEP